MKVAIDTSPLSSGHKVRGIGSYTQNLVNSLKTTKEKINFEFFEGEPPSDVDLIHYPYFDLFFHTLPIKKKIKRIVTIHDVIPLVFPSYFPIGIKGNFRFLQQKMALVNTDYVICDSKTSKSDIQNKLSFPANRIKVIYLAPGNNFTKAANKSALTKVAEKYDLPGKFALYVGDVNWNKNVEGLVRAVKLAKVKLVMVGAALADDTISQTQQLNSLIAKLDLKTEVTRVGFVPDADITAIYNLAAVTVLPSFYEGFGLPALESLACGTPVVCSDNSSLSEITNESIVEYCDPSDPSDIAQKIQKILDKKNDNSQKLMQHANKFSWNKVAQETIEVYKKLASQ